MPESPENFWCTVMWSPTCRAWKNGECTARKGASVLQITTSDAVMQPHIPWSIGEVISHPCRQLSMPAEETANCCRRCREVQQHDFHCTAVSLQVIQQPLQQVDDHVIHLDVRPIGNLQQVLTVVQRCWEWSSPWSSPAGRFRWRCVVFRIRVSTF